MARFSLAWSLCLLGALSATALSQNTGGQDPAPPPPPTAPPPPPPKTNRAEAVRKALSELSPEERRRVSENIKTWKQLPPEQKDALLQREAQFRKQATEELASILKDLPEPRKEEVLRMYLSERRKLMSALRLEMEAKRKSGIQGILEQFRQTPPLRSQPDKEP